MVIRKSSLGRITANAKRSKMSRTNESPDENVLRLESMRINANQSRANESDSLRENRLRYLRNNACSDQIKHQLIVKFISLRLAIMRLIEGGYVGMIYRFYKICCNSL